MISIDRHGTLTMVFAAEYAPAQTQLVGMVARCPVPVEFQWDGGELDMKVKVGGTTPFEFATNAAGILAPLIESALAKAA